MRQKYFDTNQYLSTIFFTDSLNGWVGGYDHNGNNFVLKTSDGGKTWTSTSLHGVPSSLYFTNRDTGYCTTFYGIYKTINGGVSWNITYSDSVVYNSIKFTDENNGWAVGNTTSNNGFLLKTTNAGNNWNESPLPAVVVSPQVQLTNDSTGYFVSQKSGNIWKTSNGGNDWAECFETSSKIGTALWDISFTNELNGIAGGFLLYSTTDAGKTWKDIPKDFVFCDHVFTKGNQILIGGIGFGYSSLLYSDDWGNTWTPVLVSDSLGINDIFFIDKQNIWICGTTGYVDSTDGSTKSYNGFISKLNFSVLDSLQIPSAPAQIYPPNGATVSQPSNFEWTKSDYSFYRLQIANDSLFTNLYELVPSDGDTIHVGDSLYSYDKPALNVQPNKTYYWRVRAENKVGNSTWSQTWKFTTDPVAGIKERTIPQQFKLDQNYPNPFNPSTLISYQLPTLGHVTLDIYNILGEKVDELVNREESAGTYKVTFDASNLASGIYFYKLQAGNNVSVKKMILLK